MYSIISNGNRTEWSPIRSVYHTRPKTELDDTQSYYQFRNHKNCNFRREKKNSQVMKERENLH